jgi:hypothetical protein
MRSRPRVTLVTGRRDHEDNPLTPSRLLLACEGDELVHRVVRFYAESGDGAPPVSPLPPLLRHGKRSAFLVPPPRLPAEPINALHVTAFRDYIACPYRFYLKHVCGLGEIDDRVYELDGAAFGTVAHDVLSRFARSEVADSANAGAIVEQLHADLDDVMRLRCGAHPPAAVVLQTQQLRDRLDAFARWQATQVKERWRIVAEHTEQSVSAELKVDGVPFTIHGRIDRIDQHPTLGFRVIDYKTSDTASPPEKTHRKAGERGLEWIDLQLPLYRLLAAHRGVRERVAVGYVQLPKDLSRVGWEPAAWSDAEMRGAVEIAGQIVRKIRDGVFWPPAAETPRYDDGFASICMDGVLDRAAVIERVTREMVEATPVGPDCSRRGAEDAEVEKI